MTLPKIFLVAGVIAGMILMQVPCLAGESTSSVSYVEGTVEAIPWNTPGTLNLGDKTQLQFQYGESTYAIPYSAITGYQLGRRNHGLKSHVAAGASKVGHTVLPMLFSNDKKYLTVDFKPEGTVANEHIVFQVPKQTALEAVPVLKSWTEKNLAAASGAGAPAGDSTWWGDRYWKTTRNKHLWNTSAKQQTSGTTEIAARE